MKKLLILGVNGFIGHHLSEAVMRETDAQVAARGLSREKLRAALQGDLDAIVIKQANIYLRF